jgi:nitrite reductase/ring-hydroxylating ferredoxin subunit
MNRATGVGSMPRAARHPPAARSGAASGGSENGVPEFKVATLDELPPGRSRGVKVDGRRIGLFNVGGELFAIDDGCPHMRADLSCGAIAGRTVICGWHGWQFDLATGQCLTVEWARVRTYPLAARDGALYLTVEPEPPPDGEDEEEIPQIVWKRE